jgi:hypothetical protein
MRELALHLLDITHNSIAAKASDIEIEVEENTNKNLLKIVVKDNGSGMTEEMVSKILDPFITSRTTRKVGLGIPLLKAAAEACNGNLNIQSKIGEGTRVEAVFQHDHIDRMPLGDLPGTIYSLVVGAPEMHWKFTYKVNEKTFLFDDQIIKATLDGVPITEPIVLRFVQDMIYEGVNEIKPVNNMYLNPSLQESYHGKS